MKKVLFIDYFFPPLAADWRGVAFAKLLPKHGWEPTILSAGKDVSYDKDPSLLDELPDSLDTHRISHTELHPTVEKLLYLLRCNLSFPDRFHRWIKPAIQAGRELIQNKNFNAIYSASPTYCTAMVAYTLKREFGIPWIIDLLDGWSTNDFLLESYRNSLCTPIRGIQLRRINNTEAKLLQEADAISVIHPHLKRALKDKYSFTHSKTHVITDGFEEDIFTNLEPCHIFPDRLTITFLGSYYKQFKDDIINFSRALYEINPRAKLLFVGRGALHFHKLKLKNSVVMSHVPRRTAYRIALGSNFLFLTMPQYAKWTPTKIYDYLRIGIPILALVPNDGDAADIVNKSGDYLLPFAYNDLKTRLSSIIMEQEQESPLNTAKSDDFLRQYERGELAKSMAKVMDSISKFD